MTQHLKILNGKEVRELHALLAEQWGFTGKLEYAFLLSEKKQRLSIFTRDLAKLDLAGIDVDSMGLYFGSYYEGRLRFSVEGSQLVGPHCTKNILSLTKEEMQRWMLGEKMTLSELQEQPSEPLSGFVLVRHGDDFLGCGKIAGDAVLNYVPKTRHVHALYE